MKRLQMSGKVPTIGKIKLNEDIFTLRRKRKTNGKAIQINQGNHQNIFKDFLQSTSIPILKFAGNGSKGRIQWTFLAFIFLGSALTAGYYIYAAYSKWQMTPLLVSISSTATSIASIPFPAVTVCNLNKAERSLVENLTPNMSDYANLQTLCRKKQEKEKGDSNETGSWQELRKFILKVSQPCTEMLISCRFGSILQNCYDMFEPILTDEGLCCTFNLISHEYIFTELSRDIVVDTDYVDLIQPLRWTPEYGYEKYLPEKFYPRKALGSGIKMGLTLVLNSSKQDHFCSSTESIGFKILMHTPSEIPKISNYAYLIQNGFETQVAIQPVLQNAAPNIRQISRESRHCVFENETNLQFYQTYTETHCKLECESQELEKECGCVTYYLPRNSKNTSVCGLKDNDCVNRVRFESESLHEGTSSCDHCETACVSLKYFPLMSRIHLSPKEFLAKENLTNREIDVKELAVVHFYYRRDSFRAFTKEEYLGFADFLANTGGILGLMLGFSILSITELFYILFLLALTLYKNIIHAKSVII